MVARNISVADVEALLQAGANQVPRRLLLDFEGVEYVSSRMITKLVQLNKSIKMRGGRLMFCNASPFLDEVFKITKLNKLFDIVEDEDNGWTS